MHFLLQYKNNYICWPPISCIEKKIYHGCSLSLEKSVPRDHCLASLGQVSLCQTVTLGTNFTYRKPMKCSYNIFWFLLKTLIVALLMSMLLSSYTRNGPLSHMWSYCTKTGLPTLGKIPFLYCASSVSYPTVGQAALQKGATGCDGTLMCVRNVRLDTLEDTGAQRKRWSECSNRVDHWAHLYMWVTDEA